MTISTNAKLKLGGLNQQSWDTKLDTTSTTALEKLGAIREDLTDEFGLRKFKYVRFDQASGATAGQVQSFKANLSVANITSGTTTVITTTGLTADIYVGGYLVCIDDAGAAGAAPEGEIGLIVANTTTTITVATDDAFSVAPAVNDDFVVVYPWAVEDSAANDEVGQVAGVVMVDQDQYDYGWVQFYGIHPSVDIVAAGTALPTDESLIAGTALLTDGAGAENEMLIGYNMAAVASDQVVRKAMINLFCGPAWKIGATTI